MIKYIEHIVEPKRLILVWQAPLTSSGSRLRRIVGELVREDKESKKILLRYFHGEEDFELAKSDGFIGFLAFPVKRKEYDLNVLDTLVRRIPPRSRSDFKDYLENMRIRPVSTISDFALLGYSEARLPGDGFSIVNPFFDTVPPFEFLTEVSGFRYHKGISADISYGHLVTFVEEPENKADSNAIAVMCEDIKIGYVNRVQLSGFHNFLGNAQVNAFIDRSNGTTDRPRVQLFVEISKLSKV